MACRELNLICALLLAHGDSRVRVLGHPPTLLGVVYEQASGPCSVVAAISPASLSTPGAQQGHVPLNVNNKIFYADATLRPVIERSSKAAETVLSRLWWKCRGTEHKEQVCWVSASSDR